MQVPWPYSCCVSRASSSRGFPGQVGYTRHVQVSCSIHTVYAQTYRSAGGIFFPSTGVSSAAWNSGTFLKGGNCSHIILYFLHAHNLSEILYGFFCSYEPYTDDVAPHQFSWTLFPPGTQKPALSLPWPGWQLVRSWHLIVPPHPRTESGNRKHSAPTALSWLAPCTVNFLFSILWLHNLTLKYLLGLVRRITLPHAPSACFPTVCWDITCFLHFIAENKKA